MTRPSLKIFLLVFLLSANVPANASLWQKFGEVYVGVMSGALELVVDTIVALGPIVEAVGETVVRLIAPPEVFDADDDGVDDKVDNCEKVYNPNQNDSDADGVGDLCDEDIDGDGYLNVDDEFPSDGTEWADMDGDGLGDNSDPDVDGDGLPNNIDPYPGVPAWDDIDGDGIENQLDPDVDGDGLENAIDADVDGDGVYDDVDKFPLDARFWLDTDLDGLPDSLDLDRDGDGVKNTEDASPDDLSEDMCPV